MSQTSYIQEISEISTYINEKYGGVSQFLNDCLPVSNVGERHSLDIITEQQQNDPDITGRRTYDGFSAGGDTKFGTTSKFEPDNVQIKTEYTDDPLYYNQDQIQNQIEIDCLEQARLMVNEYPGEYGNLIEDDHDNQCISETDSHNANLMKKPHNLKLKFFICKECGNVCKTSWKLISHTRKYHSTDNNFVCPICSFHHSDKKVMKKHWRVHNFVPPTKSFKCLHCSAAFCSKYKLETHMRKHKGNRPYTCGLCFKNFTWSGGLRDHLKIHTGERPHECNFCGKKFPDTSKLKNHKRIHTGERPHVCQYCGKGFIESGKLKRHLRTHTGEKPYKCDLCGKGFNVISNLNKHMSIHNGDKPYVCDICGRSFSQNVNLKSHSRIHTGDKDPYKCETCGDRFERISLAKNHNCSGKKTESEKKVPRKKKQNIDEPWQIPKTLKKGVKYKEKKTEGKPKKTRKGMKYKKKGMVKNCNNKTNKNCSDSEQREGMYVTYTEGNNTVIQGDSEFFESQFANDNDYQPHSKDDNFSIDFEAENYITHIKVEPEDILDTSDQPSNQFSGNGEETEFDFSAIKSENL